MKVYVFQEEATGGILNGTIKAENKKPVFSGKPISVFQKQVPTTSDGLTLELGRFSSPLGTRRRLALT